MKKMLTGVSVALYAALCGGAFATGLPEAEFRAPSVANRPETWFHFIGGNVAKPGITADLEAIKGAGISGIHLFHGQFGGKWPGVEPQITCLSASWDGLVGFVADECKRLGLTFTMQNCPGWAMSGGPWIKPENAMRHLIWQRIDVEGGKRVEVKLPTLAPSAPHPKDYRDVVVLAFPATAQWGRALTPAKVSSNIKGDWDAWQRNKTSVLIDGGVTATITFDFAEPVTIRTVELPAVESLGHIFSCNPDTTVVCEANGKTLFTREIPQSNWQDDRPLTFSCDETTTKQVKVTLKPRSHAIKLRRISLFSTARNDDWEAQAGWTLRSLMRNPPAKQSESAWVKSAEVRDVSKFMKPDGTFAWDAPAGKWAVIRVGHVNTMRRNGPAPKEGTGFECDKLSTKGADVQFDNYIGRLSGEGGPVKGKMARMLMDSWECSRQTWTPGLDKVFRERLGYDLLKWMPAILGYVVDSPEVSARFLNDWRGFLGDLIADNFFARMAKRCHDRGMDITFETAFGDVIPGDILRFYKYADIPMCEFWQPRHHGGVGDHNYKPVYPCASAAHLYGKKSVAAEAFTSGQLTWDEKLRDLKYVANLHLARGVSHMVLHTYTHNPRTDWLPPGTSFGAGIGTPFLRGQTWWKFMPDFTAYLARCQAMLEAGKPANDVLWYLGDDWDHKPDENAPFPVGHKFDYCNPDALLTRISVNDKGEWTTPDGITYRVLWVPESKRMMPETMEKILDGVQKGAKAAFAALPESISTLRGGAAMQARFDKALAAMKASKNIYVGRSLESVLAAEKIAKDLIAEGVVWNHRRSDDADWYFLASARQGVGIAGAVGFRCEGEVEIWHPETGLSEKVYTASVKDGRTWVALSLAPHKSCFVVFRRGGKLDPRSVVSIAKDGKTLASAGPDHIARPREICTVLEARYGDLKTPGRWADVSAKVQAALDTRKAKITVNNAWAECDPAYQTPKAFSAKIRLPDGKVLTRSVGEGGTVSLPQVWSKTLIRENGGGYAIPFESGDYTITRADGTTENVRMSFDVTTLAGPWNVSFPEGWGMPGQMTIDALKPWKELGTTLEAKAFSGTADYTIDFTLDKVDEGTIVVLDLGRVESLAKVEVNGKDFGDVWSPPYRIPLTGAVKAGKNTLRVSVTDTWYNRLVFDAGQPEAKRRTWTLAGPKKNNALRDSGLIGPVRVIRCRIAAPCAVAGEAAMQHPETGRKDAPVAGARVGFALTMVKRDGSTFTCVDTVTHQRMASLSVATNGSVVTAVWRGYPKCGANFRVTARFTLLPNGGFEYSGFDWAGNESPFYVHRVSFPEVAVPRTEKTAVFRPHAMGEVFRPNWRKFKPGKTVSTTAADYLAFNCIATMDDGANSHFLDMRGEARRVSPTAFYVRNGERRNEAVLCIAYAPAMPEGMRGAGTMPFTGVYAPYRGGWYEAAKMHRAWMETQPWFKAAAARDFSKLREIALWMWGRGGVDVVEEPVKWFMKETGLKVALDWYWWHNVPYDTAYPFFWPPRDGEEAFRASVKRMKEAGAFVQVYTNGMLWDCDDPRWADGGLDSTLIRANGRVHSLVFNPYTKKRQAWMCGEASKFQSMMRQLERTLAGTGLDGVYMDMIACAAHMPCFNPRHRHAPGGGTAVIDGYRDYVRKVHEDNPGFILSSETPSESYLDLFEAFILPHPSWERVGYGTLPEHEPVPAATVIYRDAAVVFGSYATPGGVPAWDPLWGVNPDKPDVEEIVAKYPDQFAVEFARGVVWGMQPMVHNFTMKDVENPRIAHDVQYMKDTAKFYHAHRDFLFDGTLLKSTKLTCATKRTAFLSAGCYTRPQDGKVVVQKALPTVLHSEWRARDGREAAVLANWTMEPQTYRLDFGGGKTVSGTLAAREWRLVNPPHAYWNSDSYALNDDVDIGFDRNFPLWIFGFMY